MLQANSTQARIISRDKSTITLDILRKPEGDGCQGCSQKVNQCGKRQQVVLASQTVVNGVSGDIITFVKNDDQIFRAACAGYGLPLLGFVGGAVCGQWLGGELASVLMALVGMAMPLLFLE